MQLALELTEGTTAKNRDEEARPVERLVSQPWLQTDKPWWWRQRQLHLAAQEHGAKLIIYQSGEYGPSLVRAREARDDFYRRNVAAALNAAG